MVRPTQLTARLIRAHARRARGLSLVEILVVIAVIVLLLAILMPSLGSAREQGRRMVCTGNLRQWGVALQLYRTDHNGAIPKEGTFGTEALQKGSAWFNALPPYLEMPPYRDIEGVNEAIREFPNLHVWICPSKNLTDAYKSRSGKNQFHYGMNEVLDGRGDGGDDTDTPGFPDWELVHNDVDSVKHLNARFFAKEPHTVFMFDIAPNSPRGSPREVATEYQRDYDGGPVGKFHGDYANLLYLDGGVTHCTTDDLVTDRDFRHGDIVWRHPRLYWGYRPERE